MAQPSHTTRLTCPDGLTLGLDLYTPQSVGAPLPVVVFCHGLMGFKDWGLFPPLAERLAATGRAVALFDFSHNGVGERPGQHDKPELFECQTVTRHLEDLSLVLACLDDSELARRAGLQCNHHFNVVGHSLGAAIAVLAAAQDGRIVQLATLNGLARLERSTEAQQQELAANGRVELTNSRTGAKLPLGAAWFEDLRRHDLEEAATQVFVPALVVASEQDESVPPAESRQLNDWIAGSRLVSVPDTGHTFGAVHPFSDWTPALTRVAAELDAFLPHVGRLGGI